MKRNTMPWPHWPGNRTPARWRADLSVEIALRFARAGAREQREFLGDAERHGVVAKPEERVGVVEVLGHRTVGPGIDQTEFYPLLNKFVDLNPAVIAGTSTAAPTFSAFIKQADEVGLESLIIADGLGWFGEWYDLTGSASNYVIDQIPGWATAEGQAFAEQFEAEQGFPPSPSAAGLSYDGSNFFISVAKAVCRDAGELTSESIYNFVKDNVWTGDWTYTDGIVMSEYQYTPEIVPDPVVGKGFYIFPVLQYFDGEGKIIYPPEWAEQQLTPKGAAPAEAVEAAIRFSAVLGRLGTPST